jgi:hypothetical protein
VLGDFPAEVQSVIGPLLTDFGFAVDEIDNTVDEGGPKGSVVFFRSKDSKIQIYRSSREGEINAMIGALDAPNEHGLYDRSGSGTTSKLSPKNPNCRWKNWCRSFGTSASTSKPRRSGSSGSKGSEYFGISNRRVQP